MAKHTTSDQTITKTIYIKRGPSVLDQITLNQALGLFVQTVQAACDLDPSKSVAIVIDGARRYTTRQAPRYCRKILATIQGGISSPTDNEITKPFYRALRSNEHHVKHVHLDTSDPSSIEDVSRYLFWNVRQLVLNWEEWPGEEHMKMICVRASGLFIWAVTVMKSFQEQLSQSEYERLDELLDVINDEGMGDVGRLYVKITCNIETNTKTQNGVKESLPLGDFGALLDLTFCYELEDDVGCWSQRKTIPRLHKIICRIYYE